eukprot:CAMPEP_0179333328 /NCGR_PEP_ID=MMETSP0797-20121207/65239_1 /TAXON_ID=47934 /ORGANISM="Dinophysis acuminata, Strain DAEP01" /LENGTH=38 /DNA_ID= /DNA_START= /DNA_END= /DNA_ORIENTATION=
MDSGKPATVAVCPSSHAVASDLADWWLQTPATPPHASA